MSMDVESLMVTPLLDRDIGSDMVVRSGMTNPMIGYPGLNLPMSTMGLSGGMGTPATGSVGKMRPQLTKDKYERFENKDKETKKSMKTAAIILASIVGFGILKRKFPNAIKSVRKFICGLFKKRP